MTVDSLYEKFNLIQFGEMPEDHLRSVCEHYFPIINEIEELKKQTNTIVLAHSYVKSNIIYAVADYVGDSYELSKNARDADEKRIIFAAVRFMGETAKILSPDKEVLIPGTDPACSLADSITAEDVRKLKKENPGYAFLCYINTNADVKAECDACVTSSNVYNIVEKYPSDKIYFVPDKLMGQNVIDEMEKRGVKKDIKVWNGTCYVHEEYDASLVDALREKYKDLSVLVHPECGPSVLEKADFVGSTSQLYNFVKHQKDGHFLMLTECGLISRIEAELPGRKFVGSCSLCKYMKSNTLEGILRVLKNPTPSDYVQIDIGVQDRALKCINRMFEIAES
ncbi:quinolinate synthase NadA [Oceanispirochaeta sp.]|jgi:quinolinate synthase|uniref:quinolinate synthase NadA n=1 Tax=Oceanispirochaeta sp. TaxID=2035350 RepID=UPI0026234376|nr:quinolinate synthase NadA [Oceanispirochaeta sp.]MDA3956369.1 quinolinate synthase NadA [Oceanispirochaeta sp.]